MENNKPIHRAYAGDFHIIQKTIGFYMNYKKYDAETQWSYRADLLEITKQLGYTYISEAIHSEYKKRKSTRATGEAFERSTAWAGWHLNRMNVKMNSRGGNNR